MKVNPNDLKSENTIKRRKYYAKKTKNEQQEIQEELLPELQTK